MKYLYNFIVLSLFFNLTSTGQVPGWQGLYNVAAQGGSGIGRNSMLLDAQGNIYIAGTESGGLAIGNFGQGNYGLKRDAFLAKFDSSGNPLMLTGVTPLYDAFSITDNYANGISTDYNGHVFVGGSFAYIPYGLIDTPIYYSAYDTFDIYVSKFDTGGDMLWIRTCGGRLSAYMYGMSTDYAGNTVELGGSASDTIFFGDQILLNEGNPGFMVKYDTAGNILWTLSLRVVPNAVCFDPAGNIYITAGISGPDIILGDDTFSTYYDGYYYAEDILTVKFDPDGNLMWARKSSGKEEDEGDGIIADSAHNVYLVGTFTSDTFYIGNTFLTTGPNTSSGFIAKYDSSGNLWWAAKTGDGYSTGIGLNAGPDGNLYVTGSYSKTLYFGSDSLSIPPGALFYPYVLKYDTAGKVLWHVNGMCDDGAVGLGLAVDVNNNVDVAIGYNAGPLILGQDTFIQSIIAEGLALAQLNYNSPVTSVTRTYGNSDIKVYPNPGPGMVNFSGVPPNSTIEIFDLMGENIYTTLAEGAVQSINLSSVSKGIYIYRVINANEQGETGKIVIE